VPTVPASSRKNSEQTAEKQPEGAGFRSRVGRSQGRATRARKIAARLVLPNSGEGQAGDLQSQSVLSSIPLNS